MTIRMQMPLLRTETVAQEILSSKEKVIASIFLDLSPHAHHKNEPHLATPMTSEVSQIYSHSSFS
jgi:hypothetical protein